MIMPKWNSLQTRLLSSSLSSIICPDQANLKAICLTHDNNRCLLSSLYDSKLAFKVPCDAEHGQNGSSEFSETEALSFLLYTEAASLRAHTIWRLSQAVTLTLCDAFSGVIPVTFISWGCPQVICREECWNHHLIGVPPVHEFTVCAKAFGRGLSN
jgi:hypothetical protein